MPRAIIDVRVTKTVVQIPIERSIITAIIPIATDEGTKRTTRPEKRNFNPYLYLTFKN